MLMKVIHAAGLSTAMLFWGTTATGTWTLAAQDATTSPAPAAMTGDARKGKKVFRKCKACHSLKEGRNGSGPTLYGIIGAEAGAVDGFKYSTAMAESGLVWDAETLGTFLKKPKEALPGTKMQFTGLRKDADIENLLAYLADQ